jgi:hypothetical protein
MTRGKQIIEEAKRIIAEAHERGKNDPMVDLAITLSFSLGARWADKNPDIDVRTMAAWRGGYKEAIEKACEWLRTNLCEHYADEPIAHKMGRPISGYISFFEEPPVAVIGDFLKAMKGGNQ